MQGREAGQQVRRLGGFWLQAGASVFMQQAQRGDTALSCMSLKVGQHSPCWLGAVCRCNRHHPHPPAPSWPLGAAKSWGLQGKQGKQVPAVPFPTGAAHSHRAPLLLAVTMSTCQTLL